jgi:hypothetical protein
VISAVSLPDVRETRGNRPAHAPVATPTASAFRLPPPGRSRVAPARPSPTRNSPAMVATVFAPRVKVATPPQPPERSLAASLPVGASKPLAIREVTSARWSRIPRRPRRAHLPLELNDVARPPPPGGYRRRCRCRPARLVVKKAATRVPTPGGDPASRTKAGGQALSGRRHRWVSSPLRLATQQSRCSTGSGPGTRGVWRPQVGRRRPAAPLVPRGYIDVSHPGGPSGPRLRPRRAPAGEAFRVGRHHVVPVRRCERRCPRRRSGHLRGAAVPRRPWRRPRLLPISFRVAPTLSVLCHCRRRSRDGRRGSPAGSGR